MASTFTTYIGTVSFTATTTSWAEPSESSVEVIGFPGGDAVAISIAGQRETRRTFTAVFATPAAFQLFRNMRAKQGFLFVENWDSSAVRAILVRTAPSPPHMSGEVSCSAQFILY